MAHGQVHDTPISQVSSVVDVLDISSTHLLLRNISLYIGQATSSLLLRESCAHVLSIASVCQNDRRLVLPVLPV